MHLGPYHYPHIFTLGFLSAIQEILLLLMTISIKSQSTLRYRTQGHQPKVFIHPAQDREMLNTPPFPNILKVLVSPFIKFFIRPNLSLLRHYRTTNPGKSRQIQATAAKD